MLQQGEELNKFGQPNHMCKSEVPRCFLLVNVRKGMQSSSEQPLVGEERVTTLTKAVKETNMG